MQTKAKCKECHKKNNNNNNNTQYNNHNFVIQFVVVINLTYDRAGQRCNSGGKNLDLYMTFLKGYLKVDDLIYIRYPRDMLYEYKNAHMNRRSPRGLIWIKHFWFLLRFLLITDILVERLWIEYL